ncbi:YraN family protein [Cryobacterium sp. CG_9.6]|uniref:YraN family protein n=1 Tax=Cryobacterium sp. CG_9.6 TaxID=2760710 RepID=UPI002476220A|nr:YraN family protein [Cryobacterium sp. CG_9.6]MDH6237486.1 putative endonuclease [Cryobacterium sp. CG_9.6]
MARKDQLGRYGEDCAAAYLVAEGYSVIDRNWRCPDGEVDLIVERGAEVVFVEVKTRSSVSFGHPFEAITAEKLARMRRLAGLWCSQAQVWPAHIRVDAIAVIAARGREPVIEHLQGVF